jgi:hypothetical protein
VPAGLAHHRRALLGVHLAPVDPDVGDAGVQPDPLLDLALDLGAQGATTDGELDPDRHHPVGRDAHAGDHAERDDVGAQFGIDHGPQHALDLVSRGWSGAVGAHGEHFTGVGRVISHHGR